MFDVKPKENLNKISLNFHIGIFYFLTVQIQILQSQKLFQFLKD